MRNMRQFTIKVGKSGQLRRIVADTFDDAIFLAKHLGYVKEKYISCGAAFLDTTSSGVIINKVLVEYNIIALKRAAKIDGLLEK